MVPPGTLADFVIIVRRMWLGAQKWSRISQIVCDRCEKIIPGYETGFTGKFLAIAPPHSLYAMIGENPRSIDDFYSSGAHIEYRASAMVVIFLTCTS